MGSLTFAPARECLDLLAKPVAGALSSLSGADEIGVSEIDPTMSDTAAFCEAYSLGLETAANCVIVEGKRGEERQMAACVILATTRVDVNNTVKKLLDVKKVSFAQMEKAVSESGMEFGAITPIGLPNNWPIFVDKAVADSARVIIGSGIRKSKLSVEGSLFANLPGVQIIEGLAQPKPSA